MNEITDPDILARFNESRSAPVTDSDVLARFNASKPEAGSWAHKALGVSPESRTGHAIGMVTDVPREIYEAGKSAVGSINEAFNPWSQTQKELGKGEGISNQLEKLKATGRGLFGIGELAASPITGAGRAIIGHGLTAATPQMVPYEETKRTADLATMAFAPGRGVRPVPVPPRPMSGPFGVTLSEGQETGALGAIQREQAALRDAKAPGHKHAQEFEAQQKAQLQQAREDMARSLDPYDQRIVASPQEAGELASNTIQTEAARAKAGVDAAYRAARGLPGEIHAGVFEGIGQKIKGDLSFAPEPVIIDDRTTPYASMAVKYLDDQIANLRIQNRADPFGAPNAQNITGVNLAGVDQWRKNLSAMRRQAYESGNSSDGRATRAVLDAFDDHVTAAVNDPGLFTGSPQAVQAWNDARAAHSDYRKTFTAGKGDAVGREIEKITGKGLAQPAIGNDVIDALVGRTGTDASTRVVGTATRVRNILGADSPEWHGVRQGLFDRLTDGQTPAVAAKRIKQFLNQGGVELSRVMFSPAERQMLQNYADMLEKLRVPQAGANWSNTATFRQRAANTISNKIGTAIGAAVGGLLGFKMGIPFGIEAGIGVGAGVSKGLGKIGNLPEVRAIARQMPIVAQQIQRWQKAVAAANRANTPVSQQAVATAWGNLAASLQRLGINPQVLLPGHAGEQEDHAPRPMEGQKYGGVVGKLDGFAHGGKATTAPANRKGKGRFFHPVHIGAKKAKDGHWYVKDPRSGREGKYLRVEHGRRAHP